MLPNRKKKIFIVLLIIFIAVLVIWGIAIITKYINDKNDNKLRNDNYANLYDYYGILKDKDGVYKLYGINNEEEKYLELRTFYDILDLKVIDNHIVLFSDATNEVRYNEIKNEFYFYELDSDYQKGYSYYLMDKYLVKYNDNTLKIKSYGSNEEKLITDKLYKKGVIIYQDNIYYLNPDGIYEYNIDIDMAIKKNDLINNDITFLAVNENQLYYKYEDELHLVNLNNKIDMDISKYLESNIEIVNNNDKGFIYINKDTNKLKEYIDLNSDLKEYSFKDVTKGIKITDDNYYLKMNEKNVIVDLKQETIIKELANDYLYIVKVG